MQKKMIALAVAGLVSGAAFAQSNVTVFGIMDVGYQYSWGNTSPDQKNSKSEIKAGGQDGSRVGFRGTEDLGNGLKANFEMVAGFNADTGTNTDYGNGSLMNEGAWLGLEGAKWGQVKAGYFGTFLDDNTGIDVTGRIGAGSTGVLYGTGKYENFVAWYSPMWSGFQVKAGYSSNIAAQDRTPYAYTSPLFVDYNMRAYTAAASYVNGGLKLGAAYASYQPQDVSNGIKTDNGSEWNAGIAYDFGMASVSLFGAQQNNATPSVAGGAGFGIDSRDFWALGVKFPFNAGKDSVALGYGEIKNKYVNDAIDDTKNHAFTITYLHALSKRTNVYALYGNTGGDDFANTNTPVYSIGGYKNAFNVGLRHLF